MLFFPLLLVLKFVISSLLTLKKSIKYNEEKDIPIYTLQNLDEPLLLVWKHTRLYVLLNNVAYLHLFCCVFTFQNVIGVLIYLILLTAT